MEKSVRMQWMGDKKRHVDTQSAQDQDWCSCRWHGGHGRILSRRCEAGFQFCRLRVEVANNCATCMMSQKFFFFFFFFFFTCCLMRTFGIVFPKDKKNTELRVATSEGTVRHQRSRAAVPRARATGRGEDGAHGDTSGRPNIPTRGMTVVW